MPETPLRILQVNTSDVGGGAEVVARNLHRAYRSRGHTSHLAVGFRKTGDPCAIEMCGSAQPAASDRESASGRRAAALSRLVNRGAAPFRWAQKKARRKAMKWMGHENFHFPGTWKLLDLVDSPPDVVHCHNLHGNYFDLRALPWLSRQVPTMITLHDAWLLSGHCAHAIDCDRWKTGCGACPDLTIYPAIHRDGTRFNWRRKQELYRQSRIYISAPSRWILDRVRQSMLAAALVDARVIPNGVDRSIYRPIDSRLARSQLSLPLDAKILLFAANATKRNPFKDFEALRRAVAEVGHRLARERIIFLALGSQTATVEAGAAEIRSVPMIVSPHEMARYYQAADLYLHAARADTFPLTVLEALACGKPVVATAVGGIPEQVRSIELPLRPGPGIETHPPSTATGALVPVGDSKSLATAIIELLTRDELRGQLAGNAALDAKERFDFEDQVEAHLDWYAQIAGHRQSKAA